MATLDVASAPQVAVTVCTTRELRPANFEPWLPTPLIAGRGSCTSSAARTDDLAGKDMPKLQYYSVCAPLQALRPWPAPAHCAFCPPQACVDPIRPIASSCDPWFVVGTEGARVFAFAAAVYAS
eukprot:2841614-Amphidinium_carterae.1